MHYLSFDGQKIYYEFGAKNEKPLGTIIIAHGLGGNTNSSLVLVEKLSKLIPKYNIVVYDLRGHGYSTSVFPKTYKTFEQTHARDLQAICNYLNISQPIFIGHCMGGIIVQEYIASNLQPKPVKSIFLCTFLKVPSVSFFRSIWFKLLQHFPPSKRVNNKLSKEKYKYFGTKGDIHITRIFKDMTNVRGFIRWLTYYLSILGWKNSRIDSLNNSNNYFLVGNQDAFISKELQKKHFKKIPQAKTHYEDVNHICIISKPSITAQYIAKCITEKKENK